MDREFFFTILLEDNVLRYTYSNNLVPIKVKEFDSDSLQFKTIDLLAKLARNHQLNKDQLQILGEQLYNVLLEEKMFDRLSTLVKNSGNEGSLIRIGLLFIAKNREYWEWPWEYIYRPDKEGEKDINMFLTENNKYIIVRQLLKEDGRKSLIDGGEIRMLFVASGPTIATKSKKIKLPPVIYEGIYKDIQSIISKANNAGLPVKITLSELIDAPAPLQRCTIQKFADQLKCDPHIIHILAHGRFNEETNRGEILFMKEDESEDWIGSDKLKTLLAECSNLKLVFLESCETAVANRLNPMSGVAQKLSEADIPSVIAMQSEIVQNDAHLFSAVFYEQLFSGRSVYSSMKEAIVKIRNANLSDPSDKNSFGIPVLYAGDDGILFKSQEPKNIQSQRGNAAGSGKTATGENDDKQLSDEEKKKKREDLLRQVAELDAQIPQSAETGSPDTNKTVNNPIQTKIDANKV